jgi:anti-anti-sigma factor
VVDNFQLLLHRAGGDALVLALRGEVDMATAGMVKQAATKAITDDGYRRLVLDLSQVSFMDSSGLHAIVDAQRAMQAAGGQVKVVNGSPSLARIFELTGLNRLLTVVPDREAALAVA